MTSGSNGIATAGLVVGIVSILLFWTFGFGVLLGIVAVVLGAIGMKRAERLPGRLNRGQGLAGVITGAAGIVLGVAFVVVVVMAAEEFDGEMNSDPPDGSCDEERFFQDPDC